MSGKQMQKRSSIKSIERQNTKLSKMELPENFDINRGLIMFGKNKKNKNFILTFDFQQKCFKKIKLTDKGTLTSEKVPFCQLLGLHHQRPRNSDCMWRNFV